MMNLRSVKSGVLSVLLAMNLSATVADASGKQQKVTLRVDGLACPFCAYGMEKKLKRIDNLEKLDIKINDGLVILYFKAGAKIDKGLISKKVKDAGFTPKEITIEGESKQEEKAMQKKQVTLSIEGMSCDGCVSRVEKALAKIECVQDIKVSLSDAKASFVCTNEKTDADTFVDAIEKLGFEAEIANGNSQ